MTLTVRLVLFLAVLLTGPTTLAQEQVTLVPYTSDAQGFSSVVPEGWTEIAPGVFARQGSATDTTLVAQQAVPAPPKEVLASLLPQLNLTEAPAAVGTHQGEALEWTLYQAEVTAGPVAAAVDVALADAAATTYVVVLQTTPDEHEALHEAVFLPILDALRPITVAAAPVSYVVDEVTFTNRDITLAGTLTLPEGTGPHPVIVLVSGSGPQDRNEDIGAPLQPFRVLADELTRSGVGVLRYDDRGVGESTGTFARATTHDFATDAEAAIEYLLTRDEIDPDQIGLLGHSEGGYVAAMLGARNEDLDFIILLAGPGVSGRDLIIRQNERLLEAEGSSQAEIDAQIAYLQEMITVLDDPEAVAALTYERVLEQVEGMPEEERAAIGDPEAYARGIAERVAAEYTTGWFASLLAYGPGPDLAETTVPVLAIFGGKDVQVDAEQNAPAVAAALEEGGNDDVEVVVLPDANHLFQAAETGSPDEYVTLPAEFTPELLPTIVDWLREHEVVDQ
jgi:hypothetical protein